MRKAQWLLALPLVLAASLGTSRASTIRDDAGLFGPEAVRKAEAKLNEIERDSGISTTIETIDSLQGKPIRDLTVRHAERSGTEGLYILIPKQEHKFEILVSRPFLHALTAPRRDTIRDAFVAGFKRGDFDGGLIEGVQTIAQEVEQAKVENGGTLRQAVPAPAVRHGVPMRRPAARPGSFGLGSLLMIGLVIIAILFGLRLLGSLFGGGQRAGYGPGPRPMGGPGYGGPGYGGGGGGGFMSSMFGGIGGALAGNWLYDQFSGRHHGGTVDNSTYGNDAGPPADAGGSDWAGGGESAGDWGGGDAGGGGDWGGGGGGDWGGGGDGGGGGGDW